MKTQNDIYIIGAGISGLIAAYELEQRGYTPTILEKTSEVGGRVKTLNEQGFDLDLGFQVLLSAYPMAKKYLNMEALNLKKLASGALIYADGKSYKIGDPLRNLSILFPTLFANIGSVKDKLNILRLNTKLKHKPIEKIFESTETTTLEYLIEFGFSKKIIDRFFKPFFAGIFLEPELSTSSRMFEFVYKMFGEGYATIPQNGIGEISNQLKNKLKQTKFVFNCEVKLVTDYEVLLGMGERKPHQGVIITSNASNLLEKSNTVTVNWKSCTCWYFEVDQTNIPKDTIALISDQGNLSNNLYAYRDQKTGKTVLSVTTLKDQKQSNDALIDLISKEVKKYAGSNQVNYIHHYKINQALPDLKNLSTMQKPSNSQVSKNVFLAGDYLLNASLNAAMESGRAAAISLGESQISNT